MSRRRPWVIAASVTILIWSGLELTLRRSSSITDDWHGWRQADTQAIARNFAFEEFNPLWPRIDWRGDGPGYVETELQLYPALIAAVMLATGESTWPGQLISLVSIMLAASVVFATLARRFGGLPAFAALLAVLSCQGVVVIGTSIQPDALAFLAFTIGFVSFAAWLEDPTQRLLFAWVVATSAAGLIKATTLELGIAQGVLVLLTNRSALRRPALWLGWAVVLVAVIVFLLHARGLYVVYGNTFGVLSGGDSKLPTLDALANPLTWKNLAGYTVVWGISWLAVPAGVFLVLRRRIGAEELALAAGAAVLCVVALRYTSGKFGTHYHLPHIVLGAWLVARAVGAIERPNVARLSLVATIALSAILYGRAVYHVATLPPEPETVVGRQLATVAPPGTLVAVRTRAPRYEANWNTVNNFEDPRVFYLSRTRGWAIGSDESGTARIAELARRGARFYAHVTQIPRDPELTDWLESNGTLVASAPQGYLYRLHPFSTRVK